VERDDAILRAVRDGLDLAVDGPIGRGVAAAVLAGEVDNAQKVVVRRAGRVTEQLNRWASACASVRRDGPDEAGRAVAQLVQPRADHVAVGTLDRREGALDVTVRRDRGCD